MISSRTSRSRRNKEPIDVYLTVTFRFGDEPDDRVTMIDNRRIPMINSIFDSRDAVLKAFARLMLKAGLSQPKVVRELVPALKLLRPGRARK